jgi:uncharacterized protein (DUF697 family)
MNHRRILAAAIKTTSGAVIVIMPPFRHADIVLQANIQAQHIKGFIDSHGQFLNREEAWTVAREAYQIGPWVENLNDIVSVLRTEDLW